MVFWYHWTYKIEWCESNTLKYLNVQFIEIIYLAAIFKLWIKYLRCQVKSMCWGTLFLKIMLRVHDQKYLMTSYLRDHVVLWHMRKNVEHLHPGEVQPPWENKAYRKDTKSLSLTQIPRRSCKVMEDLEKKLDIKLLRYLLKPSKGKNSILIPYINPLRVHS